MSSLIAWGKYLVAETGDCPSILEDGAMYVEDGVIKEVASYPVLRRRYPSAPEIGSTDTVTLPGLVNAHQHGNGLPFSERGRRDAPLEVWALRKWLPGDEDPYWDTLLCCMKLMESGVTTTVHSHPDRYPENYEWRAERALQAYHDAGIRVAFALSTTNQNNFVYGPDEEFLRTLPNNLRLELRIALDSGEPVSGGRFFGTFRALWGQFDQGNEGRVRVLLAPVGPQWCSDELLAEIARVAGGHRTGIHVHVLESMYQKLYGLSQYGESAVAHLADLGLVGEGVSYVHGVWLTERDAKILGETGTSVVHNPSSNLRLGSGIAPVRMLLRYGVNVAIGTDSASMNEDEDLWTEMRLGWYLHRLPGLYPGWPSGGQVLRMATLNGARVALFEKQVGNLEPGKRGDLIQVQMPSRIGPKKPEGSSILDLLVAQTSRLDVTAVVVDGNVLMRDRNFLHIDRNKVLREARRAAGSSLCGRTGLTELTSALVPYVEAFYADRDVDRMDPVYSPNSRV